MNNDLFRNPIDFRETCPPRGLSDRDTVIKKLLITSRLSLITNIMALGDDWPDLLTVREVAKILRVSPLTIKRWGKRGKLPAIRINSRGDRRYKKEAVMWLLGLQQKGQV